MIITTQFFSIYIQPPSYPHPTTVSFQNICFSKSVSQYLFCKEVHYVLCLDFTCGSLQYWFLTVPLTSLSMITYRSTHVAVNAIISLVWLSNCPLCICATSYLSSPLSMDIWVASIFWLLYIVMQWTSECLYVFESWLSLDNCPGVWLLGQMAMLCVAFWEISILFSTVVAQIYILTNSVIGFPFLNNLSSIYCL